MTIQYQLEGPGPPGKHFPRGKRIATVIFFVCFIQKFPYEESVTLSPFEAGQTVF